MKTSKIVLAFISVLFISSFNNISAVSKVESSKVDHEDPIIIMTNSVLHEDPIIIMTGD